MKAMRTGDGVFLLVAVKIVCCVLLVLAAAGLLGGVLGSFSGQGFWLVVSLIVAAMALILWFANPGASPGPKRLKWPCSSASRPQSMALLTVGIVLVFDPALSQ